VIPGTTGEQLTPTRNPRLAQRAYGVDAKVGAGSAGLENPCEFDIEGGDRDVYGEAIRLRNFLQQFEVADDEIRFGDDAQLEAAMARELFQNSASNFVARRSAGW